MSDRITMQAPRSETLPDLLDEMAERFPARDFLVYGDERLTYAEFRRRVRLLARAFTALGVEKGDKVALLMGNQTEWLLTVFATTLIGATFVALNTWWRGRELEYALALSDAKVLVLADQYAGNDYLDELARIENRPTALPHLVHIVCLGRSDARLPDVLSFDALLDRASEVDEPRIDAAQRTVSPHDVAFILFTSGSSAHPKAVQNEHWGLIRNLFQIGERIHLTEADRILVSISLFWGFGVANALFSIMTHGACMVLQHRFDAAEALMLLERERCTGFYATPNIALALLGHPDRPQRDLGALRTGLGMPAAISPMVELGATQACSLYGLTECYGNSVVADADEPLEIRRSTCGRPLPGTELVIADPESHAPLPVGSTGEIKLRGFVMPGYYRDPQKTAEALDQDGFFLTGDLGMLDEAGYLHFRGRLKEMVKSGGINISPSEVEEMLRSHDAVDQALVVGVPDEIRDEVLAAGVVLKKGSVLSADELRAFCRRQMAIYKVPHRVFFLADDQVPLTATGKPDKAALQRQFIAALQRNSSTTG